MFPGVRLELWPRTDAGTVAANPCPFAKPAWRAMMHKSAQFEEISWRQETFFAVPERQHLYYSCTVLCKRRWLFRLAPAWHCRLGLAVTGQNYSLSMVPTVLLHPVLDQHCKEVQRVSLVGFQVKLANIAKKCNGSLIGWGVMGGKDEFEFWCSSNIREFYSLRQTGWQFDCIRTAQSHRKPSFYLLFICISCFW